ncbi:MAG TPA: hypothetical protein PKX00_08005 [Opitutaceae bacterium]|jgi:hypothetical protein|nr:hypothetical protein [Opitutaceae bacterium]
MRATRPSPSTLTTALRLGALALVLAAGASLPAAAQIPYVYVYPKAPFDVAAAEVQMSPGTSTLRGTIAAKERKALIKALNISKTHTAGRGTVVTLMPYTKHVEEWVALDKKISRKATLEKAALKPEAASYRILTKVTDDSGGFEFTGLRPGKYFVFANVNFVESGTYLEQTGSVDTYIGGARVESIPTYTGRSYAADVSKAVTAIVDIVQDGQTVTVSITGQ